MAKSSARAPMILAIDLIATHGGGQQVLFDLMDVALRSGKQVTAIVAKDGWLDRSRIGREPHVTVHVPTRRQTSMLWRGYRFLRFCWTMLRLRTLLDDATLVIVNDPELFLPTALLAWLRRRKVVLYLHMAYRGFSRTVIRVAAALPSVDRLICVSHFVRGHTADFIGAVTAEKLVVVENALPNDSVGMGDALDHGDLSRIAVVGRLVPDKGQDVVCTLSRELPDCQFYLVGPAENADDAYVARLRADCRSNVTFAGYQHPVIEYLHRMRCGILLVPSRIPEGFSLTAVEGAVAGCAIIARNLGGLGEVARNLGASVVEGDARFLPEIQRLRSMNRKDLISVLDTARQRALSRYHPRRFERDVIGLLGWQ